MICTSCSHENRPESRFCEDCGAALAPSVCGQCGNELRAQARFCDGCGTPAVTGAPSPPRPVGMEPAAASVTNSSAQGTHRDAVPASFTPRHLADKILGSRAAMEGERKQVTVVFADIKGSMDLAEQVDPEDWHTILDRFFSILAAAVHRYEGSVNQYTGDGIMALFGAPISHEDHGHRACHAALAMREEIREYAREVRARFGVPLELRIGMNSGEVIVGKIGDDLRMDYTALGHVVGLGQRMESLAESGTICLSGATADLVRGYFQMTDLGGVRVKGAEQPVATYQLEGLGPFRTRLDQSRSRGLSTFVGRADELDVLDLGLRGAMQGNGQLVGVVADAGVGKSRLCLEFIQRCRTQGLAVYEGHCPSHGRFLPYLPIIETLRSFFGIGDEDQARTAREKIAGRLLLVDRALESSLPVLWQFLGVADTQPSGAGDEVSQSRIAAVLRKIVPMATAENPTVIFVDDLHWIDPGSDELLLAVAEAIRTTHTLLLVNFRPEYSASWMEWENYAQVDLNPLGQEEIRALVEALVGAHPSLRDLAETIAERSAGNPFFTEEIVQSLVEDGRLVGSRGAYEIVGESRAFDIPNSVQSVLAARIDRLAEDQKAVLQTASVIGRRFDADLLRDLVSLPDVNQPAVLASLSSLGLIYEEAGDGTSAYCFRHPLTHEVAYAGQLVARRRELHAAVARLLEGRAAGAALLAYHWDQAGNEERAVHWHTRAASELGFADGRQTLAHWKRAAVLAENLPQTSENMVLAARAWARSLWLESRWAMEPEQAQEYYRVALDLAERADSLPEQAIAEMCYGSFLSTTANGSDISHLERALFLANAAGDLSARVCATWALCTAWSFSCEFQRGLEAIEAVLEESAENPMVGYETLGYEPYVFLRALRMSFLGDLGRLRDARVEYDAIFARADRSAPVFGPIQCIGGRLAFLEGDAKRALSEGERGLALAESTRNPAAVVYCGGQVSDALAAMGKWSRCEAVARHSLDQAVANNTFLQRAAGIYATLAWALIARGALDEATTVLDQGWALAERSSNRLARFDLELAQAGLFMAAQPSNHEAARERLDAALHGCAETGARGRMLQVLWALADWHAATGDVVAECACLDDAAALAAEIHAQPLLASIRKRREALG